MLDPRLLREGRKDKKKLFILVALGGSNALGAIIQAYLLTTIINSCFLQKQQLEDVGGFLGFFFLVVCVRAFFMWQGDFLAHRFADQIKTRLREKLLTHIFSLGPVGASQVPAGILLHTVTAGVEGIEDYFAKFLPGIAMAGLIPAAMLAVTLSFDFTSFLLMLITAPLIPFFMILIGKRANRLNEAQWEVLSRLNAHLLDVLQGLTTLKLFGRSREQIAVIARLSGEFRDKTLLVLRIAFLSAFVLELIATISTALIAVTVGLKLLYGQMSFEQALFVLLITPEFYLPLRQLGSYFHAAIAGTAAADQIYSLLAIPTESVTSGEQAFPFSRQVQVKLDQVSVTYGNRKVLKDISLTIDPGQTIALVGPSGAGKTTLSRLLLGFIRPASGQILLNGKDMSRIILSDWLAHVAYVPQHPHLFYGTIAENICFGLVKSREEVKAACRAAQAHQFIEALPDGYDTSIGEGGRVLSGGQAQRLAIARAFLKDAPCLILDEATAGLDVLAAEGLHQALCQLIKGRTVILIAHRLSTVMQADKILLLKDGQIVEQGTHEDLINIKGEYHQLFSAYRRGL